MDYNLPVFRIAYLSCSLLQKGKDMKNKNQCIESIFPRKILLNAISMLAPIEN